MRPKRELKKFSNLLKRLRLDRVLTQKQLLDQLHKGGYDQKYSKADISKWEHGYYRPPAEVLEILETDILKTPPGLLLNAADYFEEAELRRQENIISELKQYIQKQFRLLAAANNQQFFDIDAGKWVTPSIDDQLESYQHSASPGTQSH